MTDTDAATITALLEELKEVDFETWNTITIRCRFIETSYATEFGQDFIQGCIQRAIATRPGWYFCVLKYSEYNDRYYAHVEPLRFEQYQYDASTPAAAILAAYIEAVRAIR